MRSRSGRKRAEPGAAAVGGAAAAPRVETRADPLRRIPPVSGTYVVVLAVSARAAVQVGRRGHFELSPGCYAYVGSALGPGGLAARIGRHLDRRAPLRWHIDYLKAAATVVEIWFAADGSRREHAWASALGRHAGASIAMPGFGSSDCGCATHLFRLPSRAAVRAARRALQAAGAGSLALVRCRAEPGAGGGERPLKSRTSSASRGF